MFQCEFKKQVFAIYDFVRMINECQRYLNFFVGWKMIDTYFVLEVRHEQ